MGFCLFNNVAVAAAALVARGLERVAIVDWDVHHGNGTQDIFYDDPRVLYVSTHQFPFYPGTGAADEIGRGDGARLHRQRARSRPARPTRDYCAVYRDVVLPVLDEFRPQLVLVSAGFDAHERDPLAAMRMTAEGYATVIASLRDVSSRYGAPALVTEGGYELAALGECLTASIEALNRPSLATMHVGDAPRGARAAARRGDPSTVLVVKSLTPVIPCLPESHQPSTRGCKREPHRSGPGNTHPRSSCRLF